MAKKNNKKKKIIVFSIVGGLILVLALVVIFSGGKEEIVTVQTAKVSRRTIVQVVEANGKIQPKDQVKINAEVSGEIITLPVKEGDIVQKNTLLARIKPDAYTAELEQAAASLNAAKSMRMQRESDLKKVELEYKRQQELYSKGFISDADLQAAKSAFEVSQAAVKASDYDVQNSEAFLKSRRESLNKTSIFSPINGVITQLISKLGERVSGSAFTQGTEIMTVSDLSVMEARVEVNENDVILISLGDTARISVDAYPDKTFDGVVSQIANTATTTGLGTQEEVTNFEVRIIIVDKGLVFRPGMSCSAKIETDTRHNVLTVPLQSVTTREGGMMGGGPKEEEGGDEGPGLAEKEEETKREKPQEVVFTVNKGRAKLMKVKTGVSSQEYIEVTEGLKEGTEIVIGNYRAVSRDLQDSSVVRVEKKAEFRKTTKKES